MKTHRALIIGLALTAAVAARSQDVAKLSSVESSHSREYSRPVLNFPRVEANYLLCLNSDIPSMVEAGLGHVTLLRIAYPAQDLSKTQQKLSDLVSRGATVSIRQKASIALQVFANPSAYRWAITDGQTSGDGLLETLAAQR